MTITNNNIFDTHQVIAFFQIFTRSIRYRKLSPVHYCFHQCDQSIGTCPGDGSLLHQVDCSCQQPPDCSSHQVPLPQALKINSRMCIFVGRTIWLFIGYFGVQKGRGGLGYFVLKPLLCPQTECLRTKCVIEVCVFACFCDQVRHLSGRSTQAGFSPPLPCNPLSPANNQLTILNIDKTLFHRNPSIKVNITVIIVIAKHLCGQQLL